MFTTIIFGALMLLSLGLLLWQFIAGMRFPLHVRKRDDADSFSPAITLLKPFRGFDEHTAECVRSWLMQKYPSSVQILFGVADEDDPVCEIIRGLIKEFPEADAALIITGEPKGANAKGSNLAGLLAQARHELVCISDADVRVPQDFLANAVTPLSDPGIGLVNCFYHLANPSTLAMQIEAIAVNADFWSQVLQSNSLKPQDFALGAVMITRRAALEKIGGFQSLLDYLADDYQLGNRIAQSGLRIELSPVVVECWDKPMSFDNVWNHQLRWARTIRVSQPVPYFFSILNNVTLWAALFALFGDLGHFPPDSVVYGDHTSIWIAAMNLGPKSISFLVAVAFMVVRSVIAAALHMRLTQRRGVLGYWWLAPIKDLLQFLVWAESFLGNTVEWRGMKFRLTRDGRLVRQL